MNYELFRPAVLTKGDKVALVAPSGSVYNNVRVDFAVEYLSQLGFEVAVGASCYARYGYLAGTDQMRADDLNQAFADPAIKGIFCFRGGYGAARILDLLDFDAIRSNPKFFCGYSDITALHVAINQMAGLMTFHTPVVGEVGFADADAFTLNAMNKYIFCGDISGQICNPQGHERHFASSSGRARGMLIGGNLSVLASLVGTAYAPHFDGKILFIEEIGEKPYRVDRMLNQLRQAGTFERCAAVIFGDFTDCTADSPEKSLTIQEIITNLDIKVPVLHNLRCGHCSPTLSLPMGAIAVLDPNTNSFAIE